MFQIIIQNLNGQIMIYIKIISFILFFAVAVTPIIFNVKIIGKIIMVIFLVGILIVNIIIFCQEEKDNKTKSIEKKNLESKVDTLLNQLESIRTENDELKIELLNQNNILKFSAELDNYIINFKVFIILDNTYSIEAINPASFGYDFHIPEKDLKFTEVYITDDNLRSNKGLMLSYKIYDVKRGGNTIGGSIHGNFTEHIRILESEIRIIPNTYFIRDIDRAYFEIILSQNLIDKVKRVAFTVNDWIIIDQPVDITYWEKIDDIRRLGGWQNYGLDQKTFYRIKPKYSAFQKPKNPWIVDLFKEPLHKLK